MTLPHDAMAQLFAASPANDLPEVPNYNVCPTQRIAVCTAEAGRRLYRPMRWGLIPHWYKAPNDGPLLINARSETVAEKPAFRAAMLARKTGVNGQVLGSPTARYFLPSALLREFVAVFWEHRVVNLSICGTLVAIGALATLTAVV